MLGMNLAYLVLVSRPLMIFTTDLACSLLQEFAGELMWCAKFHLSVNSFNI